MSDEAERLYTTSIGENKFDTPTTIAEFDDGDVVVNEEGESGGYVLLEEEQLKQLVEEVTYL